MCGKKSICFPGSAVAAIGVCILTVWCAETAAQNTAQVDGGFTRNVKVWEAQAKTVAAGLTVSAEQTTRLVDAYIAARESHTTASEAVAGPAEPPDLQRMAEVNKVERGKFQKELAGFLNPEQTDRVLLTLGSFFRRWDGMVEVLVGMDLADGPFGEAMRLTADYIAEWNKAMQAIAASGNRESMREQANRLKTKLNAEMAKILSREQMVKWTDATDKRVVHGK